LRRRSLFRHDKLAGRKHVVDGLLVALGAIDGVTANTVLTKNDPHKFLWLATQVISTIKGSKDNSEAKTNIVQRYNLTDAQVQYV
jgi:DNA gyrase/topoisomerase IV subunit A